MNAQESAARLSRYFETLTEESLQSLATFYAADAYFKDPFNEVRGVAAIRRIFAHMFATLETPRFIVTACMAGQDEASLVWRFEFSLNGMRRTISGATHLRFDATGRVAMHRDYWDAAEEVYAGVPLLGWLVRRLQRALRAPQE